MKRLCHIVIYGEGNFNHYNVIEKRFKQYIISKIIGNYKYYFEILMPEDEHSRPWNIGLPKSARMSLLTPSLYNV